MAEYNTSPGASINTSSTPAWSSDTTSAKMNANLQSANPTASSADTTSAKLNANFQSAKDTVVSCKFQLYPIKLSFASHVDAFSCPIYHQLHPEQLCDAVVEGWSGPVAENVRNQASLTSSEFQNLADTRSKPAAPAATGQPLTQYHSMYYSLLSWENPRVTGLAFAISVVFIFMTRFLNILHYAFKFSYYVLGVTAALEIAGKLLFDDGLASKLRPRKYWTIPRESIEASLDDVEQLLNFFVIESQRILYAENVYATIAVFLAALISVGLIKIVPFWGLSLMGTCVMYLAPLVYIKNREVIDGQVEHVTDVIGTQASQLRDLTAHHASQASESVKTYAGEYSQKAQEYMGSRKASTPNTTTTTKADDFPVAPKQEPAFASNTPASTSNTSAFTSNSLNNDFGHETTAPTVL